jgi:hypothetical protein
MIDAQIGAGDFQKSWTIRRSNVQTIGQQFSHLQRGPPLIRLDLLNGDRSAAHAAGQVSLGQV